MDKDKFTTIHILHETKNKLDKITEMERRKQYDVLDLAVDAYYQLFKQLNENAKKN